MRWKVPAAIALVATASLVLSGCGGAANGSSSSKPDSLTLGKASPPLSLDPSASGNGNSSRWYITPAYASLIRTGEGGNLVPGLAAKWGYVGEGNKTFEVTLRSGLKFADGTPLHAQQVVNSVEYFKKGTGPSSPFFGNITVKADGEDKVVFTSTEPDPSIPLLLTERYLGGSVISPAGLANPKQLANTTFGAGPYVLDKAQTVGGDHYVYTPNKNYFDQSQIHYKKITIKVIPDATSMVQALRSGQVDVVESDAASASAVDGVNGISIVDHPVSWDGLYFIDRDGKVAPPLAKLKVRQALNYAVDRKAIVKAVYGKYGIPNEQPTAPGDATYGYDEKTNSTYPYDPAKAKQLLAEAGYPNGFSFTGIYQSEDAAESKMVQAVASQLESVGVKVSLKPEQNLAAWVKDLVSLQYPVTAQSGTAKPAIMEIPYLFMPHGRLNPFNAENAEVAQAFDALRNAAPDDVPAAATKAIRTSVEQALSLPIVALDDIFLYNDKKVGGVQFLGPTLSNIDAWTPVG